MRMLQKIEVTLARAVMALVYTLRMAPTLTDRSAVGFATESMRSPF